jgi:hypothetical protein
MEVAPSKAEAEVDLGRLSPSARLKHSSLKLLLEASLGADPLPVATRREQASQKQAALAEENRLPKRKWADTGPSAVPIVKTFGLAGQFGGSDVKRPRSLLAGTGTGLGFNDLADPDQPPRVMKGIASSDGFDDSLSMKSTIKKSKVGVQLFHHDFKLFWIQIEYVNRRCALLDGTTVGFALNECQYIDATGKMVSSNN